MNRGLKIARSRFLIIGVCGLVVSFVQCQTPNTNSTKGRDGYQQAIQLKKGNYWVYESKTIQLQSKLVSLNQTDSVFINKDTLLAGHRYYKLENKYGLSEWKRDSLAYIVDSQGKIEFSARLTPDTLYNGLIGLGFMSTQEEKITMPAILSQPCPFTWSKDRQPRLLRIQVILPFSMMNTPSCGKCGTLKMLGLSNQYFTTGLLLHTRETLSGIR